MRLADCHREAEWHVVYKAYGVARSLALMVLGAKEWRVVIIGEDLAPAEVGASRASR